MAALEAEAKDGTDSPAQPSQSTGSDNGSLDRELVGDMANQAWCPILTALSFLLEVSEEEVSDGSLDDVGTDDLSHMTGSVATPLDDIPEFHEHGW